MEAYEDILYTVRERIARIALNRPAKLNARTPAMKKSVRPAERAAQFPGH